MCTKKHATCVHKKACHMCAFSCMLYMRSGMYATHELCTLLLACCMPVAHFNFCVCGTLLLLGLRVKCVPYSHCRCVHCLYCSGHRIRCVYYSYCSDLRIRCALLLLLGHRIRCVHYYYCTGLKIRCALLYCSGLTIMIALLYCSGLTIMIALLLRP